MSGSPSPRAALRAALLAVVLGVHGLMAAPVPHVVTREDLQNPVSKEEVERWAERLTALGWAMTPEELGERVMAITSVIGGAHRKALSPFRPLLRWTGTGQGWALFANPDNHPARLSIRVRRAEGWSILYQRLDPEHAWADDQLSYRRLRGVYDAGGFRSRPRPPYKRFAQWIGQRILAADPSVLEVEVRTLRTHTTLPGEAPDDRVEVRHVIPVRREAR